jgi:hypothetical protein
LSLHGKYFGSVYNQGAVLKKGFLTLTLVVFAFYCTPKKVVKDTPAPDANLEGLTYLWAYKPSVNVRANASSASEKISQLSDGDSVLVQKNEKGWYQVNLAPGKNGYIRSDLLAPKEFAIFPRAVQFIDSMQENRGIEIYFDKQVQHKKIYISYPDEFYSSENNIAKVTRQLAAHFQESVYQGSITTLVLKPNSKDIYKKFEISGISNADVLFPVIPFGILDIVNRDLPEKIVLFIKIPEEIDDRQFLIASRKMAEVYPLPYTHVEFRFLTENGTCRFWFLEDAAGEQYKYNHCP